MLNMFEILMWFPIFLIAGYVCEKLLWRDLGPFKYVVYCIGFVGVVIHEVCHFIMSVLVGVPPKAISVKLKSETSNGISPHGYVDTGEKSKSFMQAFLIGLAPLFFSTWLFFFCLNVIFFNPNLNGSISDDNVPFVVLGCGFVCLSLLIGLTPSKADFGFIGKAFSEDVGYSLYQICLVFLSGFLVWLLLIYFEIELMLDILYYILVFLFYYGLKYFFCLIQYILKPNQLKTRENLKADESDWLYE